MMGKRFVSLAALVVLLMATSVRADAQEIAGSFDQLRVLVKPGDTVSVTDTSGQEMRGRIADLSSTSLVLMVAGDRHSLMASDVDTIRQRRPDSLANGARWGFGVGAGLGLLVGAALAAEYGDLPVAGIGIISLLYGSIGAGAGAGIDAMISGNQVIYARRESSAAKITLTPMLTSTRRGVLVSLGF